MTNKRDNLVTRRDALATLTMSTAALVSGCAAPSPPRVAPASGVSTVGESHMNIPPSLVGKHTVVPLPFPAGALNGLSERLISSHHENNYGGAVRNLNRVEQDLAQITADTPPYVVTALRERELTFRNSKSLHEAYFANLGGDGRRSGAIEVALATAYGSTARWEEHMRATSMGLGGGSGWALLVFELDTGALRTISSANHTQALTMSVPLLVLDMYEHSYQMDFGASVAKYVDAFFLNVNWDEVNQRLDLAQRMRALVGGTPG